jgi:hypothetical protein
VKRLIAMLALIVLLSTAVCAAGSSQAAIAPDTVPTLSYYLVPPAVVATLVDTCGQTPIYAAQHLSLLIAAGDYPYIIGNRWGICQRGAAQAIADEVILPLNDVFSAHMWRTT